jgi:hypothetical protein
MNFWIVPLSRQSTAQDVQTKYHAFTVFFFCAISRKFFRKKYNKKLNLTQQKPNFSFMVLRYAAKMVNFSKFFVLIFFQLYSQIRFNIATRTLPGSKEPTEPKKKLGEKKVFTISQQYTARNFCYFGGSTGK